MSEWLDRINRQATAQAAAYLAAAHDDDPPPMYLRESRWQRAVASLRWAAGWAVDRLRHARDEVNTVLRGLQERGLLPDLNDADLDDEGMTPDV